MGEAGISSCLMQRFFDRINSCLFQTSDPRLTREAFEALIITLEQGLVYPMDVNNFEKDTFHFNFKP